MFRSFAEARDLAGVRDILKAEFAAVRERLTRELERHVEVVERARGYVAGNHSINDMTVQPVLRHTDLTELAYRAIAMQETLDQLNRDIELQASIDDKLLAARYAAADIGAVEAIVRALDAFAHLRGTRDERAVIASEASAHWLTAKEQRTLGPVTPALGEALRKAARFVALVADFSSKHYNRGESRTMARHHLNALSSADGSPVQWSPKALIIVRDASPAAVAS